MSHSLAPANRKTHWNCKNATSIKLSAGLYTENLIFHIYSALVRTSAGADSVCLTCNYVQAPYLLGSSSKSVSSLVKIIPSLAGVCGQETLHAQQQQLFRASMVEGGLTAGMIWVRGLPDLGESFT